MSAKIFFGGGGDGGGGERACVSVAVHVQDNFLSQALGVDFVFAFQIIWTNSVKQHGQ